VGVNTTARIDEEDTATFLYFFPNNSLAVVMDTIVRTYIETFLTAQYSLRTLEECQEQKKAIFDELQKSAASFFKEKGITIEYIGGSEGYTYKDEGVQNAINAVYAAEKKEAENEALKRARLKLNERDISIVDTENTNKRNRADAEAYSIEKTGRATTAVMELQGKMLLQYPGLIPMEIARRSTGQVPQTLYVTGEGQNLPFFVTLPQATPQTTPVPK